MKTILKNGRLLDSKNGFFMKKTDILIENGIIKKIGEASCDEKNVQIIDLDGYIVSPGFIDIHVHCYPENTVISSMPDEIGVKRGVTTIIDAGTSGADTVDFFYENFIKKSKTRIYIYLNIANQGLKTLDELSDIQNIDKIKIKKSLETYPELIVGLKARASGSVVKENGIKPISIGKKIALELNLPLVVHIGNTPPKVEEVLKLLETGDVITHCYNNKENGLVRNGVVIPEARDAKKRGVIFDIGHGSESFSLDIAKESIFNKFEADTISTDIYDKNLYTPVGSLENTMNKMLYLGWTLEECIVKVTHNPAKIF